MRSTTGFVWDPLYLEHQTGWGHPERPDRLTAVKKILDEGDLTAKLHKLSPRIATPDEIALIHDSEYVQKIQQTAGHDCQLDPDTSTSPKSWDAACLAVGGMLTCVDAVIGGEVSNAFAFVRPPGHHAERARAMGFCLFNNVAIAAEYALKKSNIKRVAIIDYDVHHGNGTQHAFYDRPDVFYISTHRYPFYPGTGARKEEGLGAGRGFTLNVPFPGGEGDEEYLTAFEKEIIPVSRDFRPDLILVSAGYDAHRLDPLGGMNVTSAGFGEMTERILKVADEVCGGKAILVLEGGYSLQGLAESVQICLQKMLRT